MQKIWRQNSHTICKISLFNAIKDTQKVKCKSQRCCLQNMNHEPWNELKAHCHFDWTDLNSHFPVTPSLIYTVLYLISTVTWQNEIAENQIYQKMSQIVCGGTTYNSKVQGRLVQQAAVLYVKRVTIHIIHFSAFLSSYGDIALSNLLGTVS